MYTYCYYYLFSITKGTFELVTTNKNDLLEIVECDDRLINLSKKSNNHYLDFETTEELITGLFVTSYHLNPHSTIFYQINEKNGHPIVAINNMSTDFSFRNKLHKQHIIIYNSYKQINALI